MSEKVEMNFMYGSDVARFLGMAPGTFFKFVREDKDFPVYKIGLQRKFILKEVLEYMGPHSVGKNSEI